MKKIFILAAVLLSAFALRAQSLTIAYETTTTAVNEQEVLVYLINEKGVALDLQSFALEIAHNNAYYLGVSKDAFKLIWNNKYAKIQDVKKATNIGNGYADMFQYGNVDPTTDGSATVTIPAFSKILAMRVKFQIQGQPEFFVLNQQQGQANAIFAADGSMVEYNVLGNTPTSGNPFSVDFVTVEAFPFANRQAEIRWTVAGEENSEMYIVEKSMDGELFTNVAKVPARGNSATPLSYRTIDETEMFPVNYFRIKELDVDGNATYSEVVELRFSQGEGRKLLVFPNPVVDGTLVIQRDELLANLDQIMITDQMGRIVYELQLTDKDRAENLRMDVSLLSAGIYSIQGSGADGRTGVSRFTVK
ncbi:MAG: T9SS type A sorting domain-containing protein [Bacteroidia bacterium]